MRAFLRSVAAALVTTGFDPRRLRHLGQFRRYFRDRRTFRAMGGVIAEDYPILTDFAANAGSGSGQYFHQDLLVAQFVHDAKPTRHLDIGSRIDGFVAHVATFRAIEVIDIRPMPPSIHANIRYSVLDLMDGDISGFGQADSVSCLHAIEHFGLGRYGDPLDPDGHKRGFANIARLVAPGGRLYISMPISRTTMVQFNSQRLFAVRDIFGWGAAMDNFSLERFDWVDARGDLHLEAALDDAVDCGRGLGIYTLQRRA